MTNHYTQTYNYDQYGNMVCTTGSNYCNSSLTFDAMTNHITTSGYSYDAAGNLTGDGSASNAHTFQWDAENRLISVDNGNTASYVYNALGERVEKIGGGQTTYYYHDTSGNIAMNEITSLGQTHVHEYFFPTVAGRTFAKYYWTGSAWETEYLHGNPLGSSQVVTRSDNSYAEAEVFYPFGGVRWRAGGTQDVRFAGMQERDGETSTWQDPLDPTPNRMYTSGRGRWLTPDPAGRKAVKLEDPQTWNMYAYVRNNPASLTDPSGLFVQCSSGLNKKDMATCLAIQDAAYEKDKKGNYKYQKLHDIYTALNDDKHVWTIKKATLSPGTLGQTTLQGTNQTGTDFTSGTIKMDFNQLRSLDRPSPAEKVPGFSMFAGITGNKTFKVLENFGHEGAHGVWTLNNMNLAVTEQNLANALGSMSASDPSRVPAYNVMRFIDNFTETYAQQQEQIVDAELNANPQ